MTLSVVALPTVHVDDTAVGLTLLSDLCGMLPPDVTFDFSVVGVDVGLALTQSRIGILIDNSAFTLHGAQRCEIRGLPKGYHLLRAYLMLFDGTTNNWLCMKSPVAYVEAEFFVDSPVLPSTRGFMFGQPSLALLSPRGSVPTHTLSDVICDFFVHNCGLSEAPFGFSVKVTVNSVVVARLTALTPFHLRGLDEYRGKLRIGLILVNPAGEDVLFPSYNCEEHEIILTS